jgi:hypothetical protein
MGPLVERNRAFVGGLAVAVAILAAGCAAAAEPPVRLPRPASQIAVAPDNPGTLWAATADGAFVSSDGGNRWRRVRASPADPRLAFLRKRMLVVDDRSASVVQFGGSPPTPIHRPPASFRAVTSSFYLSDRLYALDHDGRLWLSVNAGAAWVRVRAAGLPPGGTVLAARRGKTSLPDTLFVATGPAGLWVSRDFGGSFRRVPGIADATGVATTTHDATRVLVSTPHGLELSTDDGRSFRRVLAAPGITAVALDTRNWRNAFAATADGLLLRSDDGGATWDTHR